MRLGFIVTQMAHLKYQIPLMLEGKRRGLDSTVFIYKSGKYHCPYRYKKELEGLGRQYGFDIKEISDISDFHNNIVFLIEGSLVERVPDSNKKISLAIAWDFINTYDQYIHKVDLTIFPSKSVARDINVIPDKTLYLGSPKYDIKLDKDTIRNKYNITTDKNALFIHPNFHGLKQVCGHKDINISRIHGHLRKMGFTVIVKARGKAPAPDNQKGDKYIEDFSWFPHDTMELIEISDIVIILGSVTAKECIMLNKPFVNFAIALKPVLFTYLYDYDYCRLMDMDIQLDEFKNSIDKLLSIDHTEAFLKARKDHLFESGNVSAKILDKVLS